MGSRQLHFPGCHTFKIGFLIQCRYDDVKMYVLHYILVAYRRTMPNAGKVFVGQSFSHMVNFFVLTIIWEPCNRLPFAGLVLKYSLSIKDDQYMYIQ